jgi:lipid-binding SYLF domain-containing protein
MATPDKAIPNKVMREAECVAVFPSMVKVAVGFGEATAKESRLAARKTDGALRLQ